MYALSYNQYLTGRKTYSDIFEIKNKNVLNFILQINHGFRCFNGLNITVEFSENDKFEKVTPLFSQPFPVEHLQEASVSSVKFLPNKKGFIRAVYEIYGGCPVTGSLSAYIIDKDNE